MASLIRLRFSLLIVLEYGLPLVFFVSTILFAIYHGFPPGLNHDAAIYAGYATGFLSGEYPLTPYWAEHWGRETLFSLSEVPLFRTFGFHPIWTAVAGSFWGAISVICFVKLNQRFIKDARFRFACNILFATSAPLIVYSLAGWRLITLLSAVILVCDRWISFDENPRPRNAILLGAALGISLYTYNAARILPILILGLWITNLLRDKKFQKQAKTDFFYAGGSFVVFASPMLWYAMSNWKAWVGRADALAQSSNILENFFFVFQHYIWDAHGQDFFTNFAVFNGPIRLLFIPGMLALFLQRKNRIILLFFAALALPSIGFGGAYHRAIGTLPFALLGVFRLVSYVKEEIPIPYQRAYFGFATGIFMFQLVSNFNFLFKEQQPFLWGFYPEATCAAVGISDLNKRQFLNNRSANSGELAIVASNWPEATLQMIGFDGRLYFPSFVHNFENYTSKAKPLEQFQNYLQTRNKLVPLYAVVEQSFLKGSQIFEGWKNLGSIICYGTPIASIVTPPKEEGQTP